MPTNYYIGRDENGNAKLMHFKYVKREKVNGKWRYYYDSDQLKSDVGKVLGTNAKKDMKRAANMMDSARNVRSSVEKKVKSIEDEAESLKKELNRYLTEESNTPQGKAAKQKVAVANEKVRQARINDATNRNYTERIVNEGFSKYVKAKNEYDKSILGRAENAGKAVKNAAEDAGKAVKKAAENVTDKVQDIAKDTVESVSKKYSESIDNATNWVYNLFGKKRPGSNVKASTGGSMKRLKTRR